MAIRVDSVDCVRTRACLSMGSCNSGTSHCGNSVVMAKISELRATTRPLAMLCRSPCQRLLPRQGIHTTRLMPSDGGPRKTTAVIVRRFCLRASTPTWGRASFASMFRLDRCVQSTLISSPFSHCVRRQVRLGAETCRKHDTKPVSTADSSRVDGTHAAIPATTSFPLAPADGWIYSRWACFAKLPACDWLRAG